MSTEDFGLLSAVYRSGAASSQTLGMRLTVLICILLSLIGRPINLDAQQPPLVAYIGSDPAIPGTTALFTITPNGLGTRQVPLPQIVAPENPRWSRDARLVVAEATPSGGSHPDIFVFRRSGDNLRQVTNLNPSQIVAGATIEELFPAFSPEGKRLLVSELYQAPDPTFPGLFDHDVILQIFSVDGTPGPFVGVQGFGVIAPNGIPETTYDFSGWGVDWSPKTDVLAIPSGQLYFCGPLALPVHATEIWAAPVPQVSNTSSLLPPGSVQVTNSGALECQVFPTQVYNVLPIFSPDGTKLAFVRWFLQVNGNINSSIRVINVDGTGEQEVISLTGAETLGLSWSPDGTQLVYDQLPVVNGIPDASQASVSIINANGPGIPRPLIGPATGEPAWSPGTTTGDFDGDAKADRAVWRPSDGTWFTISSRNPGTFSVQQWGTIGDVPVLGDYNHDGRSDIGIWRPSTGTWFIMPSSNSGGPIIQQWGTQGDIPVPGDYYGDGKTDIAVWRPSSRTWFIFPSIGSTNSPIVRQWGTTGDIPVPGDYDGDGITDAAVFRPSTGTWFIMPSSNSGAPINQQWGTQGDIPVPGDYYGDGKTDIAVWRPSSGTWFIFPSIGSTNSPIVRQWGTLGDIPVPRDYDDDGKTDFAVWRPSNGVWFIIPSSTPTNFTVTQWGTNGDVPVQKPIGQ